MTRAFLGFLAMAALCVAALAQERSPNQGAQGILRTWPDSGVWGVALIRLVDGPLGCWLATGHSDQSSGERYFWGVRWRAESLAATITDNNQQAIAGPSIQVVIDKVPVGTYQISRRASGGNGFQNVVADFSHTDGDRMLGLISVGGAMQFITQASTYSASLQGAQQAMINFKACAMEAAHLNSASNAAGAMPQGH
jgi:hypothetical protein